MAVLRDRRGKTSSNTLTAPVHHSSHQDNMRSQRNSARHSTHAAESKMASNKLKVQTARWLKMFVAFSGCLGRRRAPGRPWSQIEDIFRIKGPCVAVVTRHQMRSFYCATHAFAHNLFRGLKKMPYTAKMILSCIHACQAYFGV